MLFGKFIDASGSLAFELSFLARAVSDDLTHYVMNQIYVEPSETKGLQGVATDGRRLHIVDPFDELAEKMGLSPGYWKVLKNSQSTVWIARLDDGTTTDYTFPNYRAVTPEGEAVYKTTFEGFTFKQCRNSNYPGLVKFIHDFPDATAIDLSYLQDLGTEFSWDVEWYGSKKAIKFTESKRMAVIMPMRFN